MPGNVQPQQQQQRRIYRGSIVHDHAHYTNEGFGSLARNMIYPIIHIALSCNLQPYISNTLYDYNTSRPNYKTDLQSITQFLSLSEQRTLGCSTIDDNEKDDVDNYIVIKLEVSTWNDTNIGSCCGDAILIAKELCDHLNRIQNRQERHWFDIRLVGAIRFMDPTPIVYEWLQGVSKTWIMDDKDGTQRQRQQQPEQKSQLCCSSNSNASDIGYGHDQTSVTDSLDVTSTSPIATATSTTANAIRTGNKTTTILRIVAHVRVPEDFTCQSWKDDNHIEVLFLALDTILQYVEACHLIYVTLDIYTEERFSIANEVEFIERYQNRAQVQTVHVHRGTTGSLVSDIQSMVLTADIFIPSSSHFSAICGYLFPPPGIIVLSHPSRYQYFTSHEQLMVDKVESDTNHHIHRSSRIIDMTQTSKSLHDNRIWQKFISEIQNRK